MSKTKNTLGMYKLILPALLSFGALYAVLFPAAGAKADSAGAEVNTKIGEFLRMAIDTDELALKDSNNNTQIMPSASGTLITGDVNVAVTTNTTQGFIISVYTQDDTTNMTHELPAVDAVISSVAGASGYDAASGIASLATDTWGFRKKTGTDTYGNWFGVGADEAHATVIENANSSSSEYCSTLAYPLETSGCSSGTYAEHTLNFGANITSALPAGTYTNNVVISAVAKSEGQRYTVSFDSNGGQNTMGSRTIVAGSAFTLPETTNVAKPGYTLAGFAFTAGATTPVYTPNQTVTVADFLAAATAAGQTPDSGITLYLIWKLNAHTVTISSGTGISSTTGSGTYVTGQTVTISATPTSGYNFSSWTVNSGGVTLSPNTTTSPATFTMPDNDVAITANSAIDCSTQICDCSSTVHPTATTGCKMADGKMWIYGNNGGTAAWTDLFTNATGASGHDATLISGKCPAGYSAPKKSDLDTLHTSYSGGGLSTALGISSLSSGREFWSSTEGYSGDAYFLYVYSSGAFTSSDDKSATFYLLCVK